MSLAVTRPAPGHTSREDAVWPVPVSTGPSQVPGCPRGAFPEEKVRLPFGASHLLRAFAPPDPGSPAPAAGLARDTRPSSGRSAVKQGKNGCAPVTLPEGPSGPPAEVGQGPNFST